MDEAGLTGSLHYRLSRVVYRCHRRKVSLFTKDGVEGCQKVNSMKLNVWKHGPSACAPVSGFAALAAASARVHKSLAAWLAAQVFVKASHINWVMTPMLSADPWLYETGT